MTHISDAADSRGHCAAKVSHVLCMCESNKRENGEAEVGETARLRNISLGLKNKQAASPETKEQSRE